MKLYTLAPSGNDNNSMPWGTPNSISLSPGERNYNLSVNPMAFVYNKFINDTNIKYNVKCRIETSDASKTVTIAVASDKANGQVVVGNRIFRNYSGVTVRTPDLGGDVYKSIVMIPINTAYDSNAAINYNAIATIYTE